MSGPVCKQCGAPIMTEGKFCTHCGAKLPEDIFKVQITVDDTAEIKRAGYEEQESQIRQKQMKQDLLRNKIAWIIIAAFAALGIVLFVCGCFVQDSMGVGGFLMLGMGSFAFAVYLAIRRAFRK